MFSDLLLALVLAAITVIFFIVIAMIDAVWTALLDWLLPKGKRGNDDTP